MAHNGHCLAGLYVKIHVSQDFPVIVVGKADMVHIDPSLPHREIRSPLPFLHRGLNGHQLPEAPKPRRSVGEYLGKVGELSDRSDEGTDIQIKGNEVHVVHTPLHDEPSSEGDHRHGHDAHEKLQGGVKPPHRLIVAALGRFKHIVGVVEPGLVHLLVGKGL